MKGFCTIIVAALILTACGSSPDSKLKGAWEESRETWEYENLEPTILCFNGKGRLRVWTNVSGWRPERAYSVLKTEGDRVWVDILVESQQQKVGDGEFVWDLSDPDRAIVQMADYSFREKEVWNRVGTFDYLCEDGTEEK